MNLVIFVGEEFQDAEPSVKLFVNNLPKNCSQDLLTVFFESKRTFGRALCVDQVEYDSEKNEAIVIFQSSEGNCNPALTLEDDKISDQSKLKACADDKINVTEN